MTKKKRWVMDVDYYSLALNGITKDRLKRMFENFVEAGIEAAFWSVAACGRSLYPSSILHMYDGSDRVSQAQRAVEAIHSFNSLATAVELAKQYGVKLFVYFRLFDDYWPGKEELNLDRMDHAWWESRCGRFQLRGWPCYALPEVREYKLRLLREITDYGVDGFLFGLTRSHSFYVNPFRQPHFWGFNKIWADEYLKRYGVDIRQFDQVIDHYCNTGDYEKWGLLFFNRFEYVGAKEFDLQAWHELKSESVVEFLRQARGILGPSKHIAIEASHHACSPTDDPNDDFPARVLFHPVDLAKEGIINEWVAPDNWQGQNFRFDEILQPHKQGMAQYGAEINIWLNDIFTPDGGSPNLWVSPERVEKYVEKIRQSDIRSATFHEADYMLQNPECDKIWKILRNH